MRPRQTLKGLFSTFLKLVEDYPGDWIADPMLSRNMERCLSDMTEPETSETFWAVYWHKHWQQNSTELALGHLSAYLQESCYWAAQTIFRAGFANAQLSLADLFQIAITQVNRILKGFNPRQGTLKSYANVAFKSVIRDALRQYHSIDICSDWALLRKTSEKRLIQALKRQGFNPETIADYQLACQCFKTLYVPTQDQGNRQLQAPDAETWKAIAHLYNQERHTQLKIAAETCSSETLKGWLKDCASSCRSYVCPKTLSSNAQTSDQGVTNYQEELPDPSQDPLRELVLEEDHAQQQIQFQQLDSLLKTILQKLKPSMAELLRLYYSEQWTQQKIADRQGVRQYTIARQLRKARQTLLVALSSWSQEQFNLPPNSQNLEQLSCFLEEWLQQYYL